MDNRLYIRRKAIQWSYQEQNLEQIELIISHHTIDIRFEWIFTVWYPPTPWSLEAKGKARGEAVHGRDTKVRHELSPEVQANRGSGASVSQRFEGRVRHTVVFRRFGRAAEGAVKVSV